MSTKYLSRKAGYPVEGIIKGKNIFPRVPVPAGYLRLQITTACNFNCFYCHREGAECGKVKQLTKHEVLDIARACDEFGIWRLCLTGGEPTTHKNIVKIVKKAKQIGIKELVLSTNGSLLEKYASKFKDAGLDGISVSLDTLQEDKLARISDVDPEMMDTIIRGIDKAIDVGIPYITLNHVVTKTNISELFDIINFATKRKIGMKLLETIEVSKETKGERIPLPTLKRYMGSLVKKEYRCPEKLASYFKLDTGNWITMYESYCDKKGLCDLCGRYMHMRISAEGKLKPCLRYPKYDIDLKPALRAGNREAERIKLKAAFTEAISNLGRGHDR